MRLLFSVTPFAFGRALLPRVLLDLPCLGPLDETSTLTQCKELTQHAAQTEVAGSYC